MNKLLMNNDIENYNIVIDNDSELIINFSNVSKNINIIVEKDICLNIIDFSLNTSNTLNISLNEEARLIYNKACVNINDKIDVLLNGVNSSCVINTSIVSNNNTNYCMNIVHNCDNTNSLVKNHAVNNCKENLDIFVNVKINNNAENSKSNQENKIINTKCGKSKILPNLIVDNENVEASHSAYISDFDLESLFYLKSRGIKEENARKLLMDGFLVGNLDLSSENKILVSEMFKI